MSIVLGIETTCDETGAGVVHDGRFVLSNVVRTQVPLHLRYGGVVPEIAARAHIESLNSVIDQALQEAKISPEQISAIGAAYCPGLVGCLLVGVSAAKALAFSWNRPLVGVNHVHAHLYAAWLGTKGEPDTSTALLQEALPALGLVISGGHTSLYLVEDFTRLTRLGSTVDDAVGEAFDKVAAILQLGYPGGPLVEQLAAQGAPDAVRFPVSLLGKDSLDFSFSGLKTAVLYHVNGPRGTQRDAGALSEAQKANTAASFQRVVAEVLCIKLRRALEKYAVRSVIVGGGVSANACIRKALLDEGAAFGLPVFLPSLRYCTDNAAMIAGLAAELHQNGRFDGLDLTAVATV
jgi:N6-L-threonylcarbamoyladenine synthase